MKSTHKKIHHSDWQTPKAQSTEKKSRLGNRVVRHFLFLCVWFFEKFRAFFVGKTNTNRCQSRHSTLGGPNWSPSYHSLLSQFPTHPWGVAQSTPGWHGVDVAPTEHPPVVPVSPACRLPSKTPHFLWAVHPVCLSDSQQFTTHGTSSNMRFFKGLVDTVREPPKWNQCNNPEVEV